MNGATRFVVRMISRLINAERRAGQRRTQDYLEALGLGEPRRR